MRNTSQQNQNTPELDANSNANAISNSNFTEDSKELESAIEGILFASGEPVHIERFCTALDIEQREAEAILRRLRDYYAYERRGMRLLRLDDKWQLCSAPDYADIIRKAFEIRKPAKLSQPALEALTIIAYYQPTTRAYVDKLRGVDSAYTVRLLEERGLIEACGRLAVPGRPVLYRTTEQFLRVFHISSLSELPPLPEGEGLGPPTGELPESAEPIVPDSHSKSNPDPDSNPNSNLNPDSNPDLNTKTDIKSAQNPEVPETPEDISDSGTEPEAPENMPDSGAEPEAENIPHGGVSVPWKNDWNLTSGPGGKQVKKIKRRRPDRKKVQKRKERMRRGKSGRHKRRIRIRPRSRRNTDAAAPDSEPPGEFESVPDYEPPDEWIPDAPYVPGILSNPPPRGQRIWRSAGRCMRCLFFGCWVSWPFWLCCF